MTGSHEDGEKKMARRIKEIKFVSLCTSACNCDMMKKGIFRLFQAAIESECLCKCFQAVKTRKIDRECGVGSTWNWIERIL